MTSLLQRGATWLAGKATDGLSASVTYRRGEDTVTLSAVRGTTAYYAPRDDGFTVKMLSQDFVVALPITLAGVSALPSRGDRIETATETYEVLDLPGQGVYRLDAHGVLCRIHTKRVVTT